MRLIPEQYVTGILPHKMQGPSRLAPRLELRDEGAVRAHEFGEVPLGGASWFLPFFRPAASSRRSSCTSAAPTFVLIAIHI
jgi:hypothetical protein